MRRRSSAAAPIGALGLLGLVALAGCPARPNAEPRGPFLSILREQGVAPARGGVPSGSIALALAGLPPGEVAHVRDCLAGSTDAAERRLAMLFDLDGPGEDDASAPDPLGEALPDLPALTAAANVLGGPWSASGLTVALGPDCAAAAARCVPLFAPAVDRADALVRRGLALAWSLGNAALLRPPAGSRVALLRSLRAAQTGPSGTIALVFDAPRGALDEPGLEGLRVQARRALAHLAPDAPHRPWLEALASARAQWELPIALDAGEVLVVPRLSAMARLQDFHAEVESASKR
jgi:hypothetical protein